MKQVLILLLSFLLVTKSEAQILKKIANRIKDDAAWRVSNKVDNEVRKGVDSLFEMPKKMKGKNTAKASTEEIDKNNTTDRQPKNKNETGNNTIDGPSEKEMKPTDGFITLSLSANKAYTGFGIIIGIRISGESVKYKNFNKVQVVVKGPSTNDVRQLQMNADGKFFTDWNPTDITGDFTVTATSSDNKVSQSENFTVETFDLPDYDQWPKANIIETKKALEKLEEAVDIAEGDISSKDKAELEKKMDELKEKVTDVLELFKEIGNANKEMMQYAKKEKRLPPNFAGNLAELNRILAEQASQMKKMNETAVHKPQDNTICEYLVMVNEACAAFSAITSIWSKTLFTIVGNIVANKPAPSTVTVTNKSSIPPDLKFMGKETGKIFAKSLLNAESLTTKLGKADIAGDLIQYVSDRLLKSYCGQYKGNFTHSYTIEFRNNKGENWWAYGAKMRATFSLRYPKKNTGDIIKMKGNLEGNATKFTFFQDVAKENDFHAVSKGKLIVVPIKTYTPLAVSVATSERDIMNFGAIARGLATPAYFNIAIDAEYDVNAKKIKIFVNKSIADFSDMVANQFIFFMVGQDLIPYPKTMSFPIHKAKTTINGIFISFKEFDVEKDSKGNENFHGKGTRHIGDKTSIRETNLNFTLTAKKE